MEEQWKPVVGFEGLYEVSDQGRVRSTPREVRFRRKNRASYIKLKAGTILKNCVTHHGYARVGLTNVAKDGYAKVHTKVVHKLVMEAFVGPSHKGIEIDHLNRNKMDARLCNLEYVTKRENINRGLSGRLKYNKSCSLSGVKVCRKSGKYISRKTWTLNCKTEHFHLGTYDTPEEAHAAYLSTTYEQAVLLKAERDKDPTGAFGRLNWNRGKPSIKI
jgi:hypothetical protein